MIFATRGISRSSGSIHLGPELMIRTLNSSNNDKRFGECEGISCIDPKAKFDPWELSSRERRRFRDNNQK